MQVFFETRYRDLLLSMYSLARVLLVVASWRIATSLTISAALRASPVHAARRDTSYPFIRTAWLTCPHLTRDRTRHDVQRTIYPCELSSISMSASVPVVRRVAIVGAGIGGLALAKALSTRSTPVEVQVFEKFDSVKPGIGGGVQLNSGAIVLSRLGLGDAIKVSIFS